MKRRVGLLLILILAALSNGCVMHNDIGVLESGALSIKTVRYGVMPGNSGKNENALYLERGFLHTANASTHVFRLDGNKNAAAEISPLYTKRKTATQITVHFGAITGDLIEIKSGLHEGDQVIVSDMSRYENQKQLLLE